MHVIPRSAEGSHFAKIPRLGLGMTREYVRLFLQACTKRSSGSLPAAFAHAIFGGASARDAHNRQYRSPAAARWRVMAVHRQTPVSEVLASSSKRQPLLLHADVTLRAAARQANERHDVHTIAVVDDEGRLVGILPVNSLIDDVFADLVPEGYLSSVGSVSALFSTAFLLA